VVHAHGNFYQQHRVSGTNCFKNVEHAYVRGEELEASKLEVQSTLTKLEFHHAGMWFYYVTGRLKGVAEL